MIRRTMIRRWRRWRMAVMKVHRRAGVVIALFALFLTITGILINHSNTLGWDRHRLASEFWLRLYGVTLEPVDHGYALSNHWVAAAGERLFFDENYVADCRLPLKGVVTVKDAVAGESAADTVGIALCADVIVLFTPAGQLIEKLPLGSEGKQGLGLVDGKPVSREVDKLFALDTEAAAWSQVAFVPDAITWSQSATLPASLSTQLQLATAPDDLTWERLLLDLHSGRILGGVGVFAVDIMGMLIVFLAISGLWGALTRRR